MKISQILRAAAEYEDALVAVYGACWSIKHSDPATAHDSFLDRSTLTQVFFEKRLKPNRYEDGFGGDVYWWNVYGRAGNEIRVIALLLAAEAAESEGL